MKKRLDELLDELYKKYLPKSDKEHCRFALLDVMAMTLLGVIKKHFPEEKAIEGDWSDLDKIPF